MSFAGFQTTHTGSLPRPADVAQRVFAAAQSGFWQEDDAGALAAAVTDIVDRQHALGLDIVNDGEITRLRYWDVFTSRLDGVDPFVDEPEMAFRNGRFPGFEQPMLEIPGYPAAPPQLTRMPVVRGAITYRGPLGLDPELHRLRDALDGAPGFVTAPSPGLLALICRDEFYGDHKPLLDAAATALSHEYRSILESGLDLQVDNPDVAGCWHNWPLAEAPAIARLHLDALRQALDGLPAERIRLHLCWGNAEAPHDDDVELEEIAELLTDLPADALVLEAANPRHEHEWRVWEDVPLGDKHLIVGVIDSTTNFVEHPEVVADRICRFADVVGPENVVAGTDCGFGTWAHHYRVDPRIAWAKLESLVEGARRATHRLTGAAQSHGRPLRQRAKEVA
jgi:5-methyltetrahydropteroyltriglutamate--homocysteine methyltransferase